MRVEVKNLLLLLLILMQQHAKLVHDTETAQPEKFQFKIDVASLTDILIHSLNTQKDIFLRELISNASDALDKLRLLAIKNPKLMEGLPNLEIYVDFDTEKHTISITDTGIGMTKNDLISNLGTIAKSGTAKIIEGLKEKEDVNIIGQFGVGFYSSFLVAQRVSVSSKHPDETIQHTWESSHANSFTIVEDTQNLLVRGTRVTLFLKGDTYDYVDERKLADLIKKHLEFISFPIYLRTISEEMQEEAAENNQKEEFNGEDKAKEGEEESKYKTKEIKEKIPNWKHINDNKPIWTKSKGEILKDEYIQFYKNFTKDNEDPLDWIHWKWSHDIRFTSILYIPKKAPIGLFNNYGFKSNSLKLYVRGVLIYEQFEDYMPKYLNFIKGVVILDDLPLNINRVSIQQAEVLRSIARYLVRQALEMIETMAKAEDEQYYDKNRDYVASTDDDDDDGDGDDSIDKDTEDKKIENKDRYKTFWKEFGKSIKLGIVQEENPFDKEMLLRLTRWYSSYNSTELTSFKQYNRRAKKNQGSIYFLAGETKEHILSHPTLQKLLQKGYEVLILDDPIDEFTFSYFYFEDYYTYYRSFQFYESWQLVNVGKGNFNFPETDHKQHNAITKVFEPLTTWWKKLLSADLDEVRISQRLHDDPCVVVSNERGYSARMESISKAQVYTNQQKPLAHQNQYIVVGRRNGILLSYIFVRNIQMKVDNYQIPEINPSHPAIKELLKRVEKDDSDAITEESAKILYEGALINSGYSLKDPSGFAKRFYSLINGALGIPKEAPIEEYEVGFDEGEEEESSTEPTKIIEDGDRIQIKGDEL